MRFKTLVLIPAIAVLASLLVSLPIAQSQTSANAPQSIASQDRVLRASELATYKKESNKKKTRSNKKASRSKNTSKYSSSKVKANQAFAKSYMESKYSWGKNQHSSLV